MGNYRSLFSDRNGIGRYFLIPIVKRGIEFGKWLRKKMKENYYVSSGRNDWRHFDLRYYSD